MSPAPDAPVRRRVDAYFTASVEVARRLAEGRGAEAIAVLTRELARTQASAGEEGPDPVGRRFLMSQVALCHARMGQADEARRVIEQMEEELPRGTETALMLSEGYLLLVEMPQRAAHHAALALQWAEEEGEATPEMLSRAHALMARAMLRESDLLGAFGAWQAAPLPDWRVGVELIEAGFEPLKVREVLGEALPRHIQHERRAGPYAVAASDQIRRLLAWIDAGCPRPR